MIQFITKLSRSNQQSTLFMYSDLMKQLNLSNLRL